MITIATGTTNLKQKLKKDNALQKKNGRYITISFKDITDTNNFNNVLKILVNEIKKMLKI